MDWEKTVADLGPRLFKYFNASFSSETAADLVQETLIRLVRKHGDGGFNSGKGSVTMYAFGIARLVRLETWKSESKQNGPPIEITPQPVDAEPVRQLRAFIRELGEIQQQVLLLYIDDELSLNEIAQLLTMPVGTVKSHLHRAKEILKERFKGAANE
jgi:RNA polymerase sigma-70 factor (ECF subfamily)